MKYLNQNQIGIAIANSATTELTVKELRVTVFHVGMAALVWYIHMDLNGNAVAEKDTGELIVKLCRSDDHRMFRSDIVRMKM